MSHVVSDGVAADKLCSLGEIHHHEAAEELFQRSSLKVSNLSDPLLNFNRTPAKRCLKCTRIFSIAW